MQWFFLILAVATALAELQTGTFYLAGVAAAALATAVVGFWIRDDLLILVFLLLCAVLLLAVAYYRRNYGRRKPLADFDIGQSVTVRQVSQRGSYISVTYRGTAWDAVMDDGAAVAPGDIAVIAGRTDKLLHLVLPAHVAQT